MHQFNWPDCVNNLRPSWSETLSKERGLGPLTFERLRDRCWMGCCYVEKWQVDCVAFPVCDPSGTVFRAHCRGPARNKDGKWEWIYVPFPDPAKRPIYPLIFGKLETAQRIYLFESQWDAVALISLLDLWDEIDRGFVTIVATRGAQYAKHLELLSWPKTAVIYAFPQVDNAGQDWLEAVLPVVAGCFVVEIPGRLNGVKDLNDWVRDAGATAYDIEAGIDHSIFRQPQKETQEPEPEPEQPKMMIEFLRPSQVLAYEPPPGIVLVGDNHVVRDAVFVLAGAPGVGKSRLLVWLARCGALPVPWMGYDVHVKFRTLVIQNENGRYRLKLEFSDLNCPELEDSLLITPPPPFGLCFDRKDFREQLNVAADEFQPHFVAIDPWNAAARDDRAKDYLETFNDVRRVFPPGLDGPAIGIAAHTRKPYPNERASGRALLNLLAGSYVLGSIPRCVWVVQAASDDVNDERIVLTCCKNNDGQLGNRSAWVRQNGLFVPADSFDWEEFDHPSGDGAKYDGTIEDLYEMIPVVKPISKISLLSKITGKIGQVKFRGFIAELLRQGRIFIHKMPSHIPGARRQVGYAKTPPQDMDIDIDINGDDDDGPTIDEDPR